MQAKDLLVLIDAAELGGCKEVLPAAQQDQTAIQAHYLLLLLQPGRSKNADTRTF